MSDRWDYIEKEMDKDFERGEVLQKEADKKRSDMLNTLYGARSDKPLFGVYQESYDFLSDERRKRHNFYKKLRKLWFKIFNF